MHAWLLAWDAVVLACGHGAACIATGNCRGAALPATLSAAGIGALCSLRPRCCLCSAGASPDEQAVALRVLPKGLQHVLELLTVQRHAWEGHSGQDKGRCQGL